MVMLRLSFVEMALHFCKHAGYINRRGYSVILIRMISDVKGRKIALLQLEKIEVSHTRILLCTVARHLAVD